MEQATVKARIGEVVHSHLIPRGVRCEGSIYHE
jgi:hypothetical protein